MPNSIKYNTESEANALGIGNMHIGTGDVPKGPTSSTGFYNGINPPNGGYTIYLNKSTQGPSIYTPSSDAELISVTNGIAGASYTTINECFNYFAGQNDKMVLANPINSIVTDGLILSLNSNILPSYPHNGTTWYDLSGNGNNTSITSADYNNGGGYFQSVGNAPDSLIFSTPNSTIINDTFNVTSGGWTIEELIRIDDTTYPEAAAGTVVSNRAYGSTQTGFDWNHGVRSGTSLNIDMSNLNTGGGASRDAEVNLAIDSEFQTYGQWLLRSIYWDRTNNKCGVYYNGVFQDSGSISGVSGYSLYDGGGISWGTLYGWHHDGARSSMKVYNKVLSESEVLQNYYQAPIVTDGLVFAVDAGNLVSYESGSTTAYSLTGSVDGTLNNGVGFSSGNGGTWEFDGTDDLINFGVTNNIFTNDTFATIECWFKSSDNGAGTVNNGCIIGTRVGKNMMLCRGTNGIAKYLYDTTTNGNQQVFGTTDVFDQEWHYIVGVFNNGATIIYIDGVSEGTGTSTAPLDISTSHDFGVGGDPQNVNRQVYGQVAIGRVYSKALTAEEVQQNYNAQINRFN